MSEILINKVFQNKNFIKYKYYKDLVNPTKPKTKQTLTLELYYKHSKYSVAQSL